MLHAVKIRVNRLIMRILVCVKRVFEADSALSIEPDGRVLPRGVPRYQMSRYDEFAVEEALRIKDGLPGVRVEALTVGPADASSVLVRAGGMGAEHGIHLLVREDDDASRPDAVASWIAAASRGKGYQLILCGVMSEDSMQGQVGPMLAERLDWPCATAVVAVDLRPGGMTLEAAREIEGGWRERVELSLPAVLTVQSGVNQPRYPALSGLLRAKQRSWETIEAGALPAVAPTIERLGAARPERVRAGRVLEGAPRDKARALLGLLAERALLREPESNR